MNDPRPPPVELQTALAGVLTAEQIVELTLTVALASAFSRISIAWGPPPDMPVFEVPTPTPGGSVA